MQLSKRVKKVSRAPSERNDEKLCNITSANKENCAMSHNLAYIIAHCIDYVYAFSYSHIPNVVRRNN